MPLNRGKIIAALFVYSFLFAGLATLAWGLYNTYQAFNSLNWPVTEGRVTASNVEESSGDSDSSTTYGAHIAYDYRVDGAPFSGSRVSLGDYSSSDPGHAQGIVARYPTGQMVRVRYDPEAPQRSVLEPGFSAGLWLPLGIGLVFTLVGGGLTYGFFRALRSGMFDQ